MQKYLQKRFNDLLQCNGTCDDMCNGTCDDTCNGMCNGMCNGTCNVRCLQQYNCTVEISYIRYNIICDTMSNFINNKKRVV